MDNNQFNPNLLNNQNMNNGNPQNSGNPALDSFNNQPAVNPSVSDANNPFIAALGPQPAENPAPMPGAEMNPGPQPMGMPGPMPGAEMNPGPQPMEMSGPMPGAEMNPSPQPMEMPGPMPGAEMNPNPQPNPMTPNENYGPQQMNGMNPQNKKSFNPLLIVIPIVLIVAAACLYFFVFSSDGNYKEPIENYCQALNDLDIEKVKSTMPKEFEHNGGFDSLEQSLNYLKEVVKNYNAKIEVTCEIKDGVKVDSTTLDNYNKQFKSDFNATRKMSKAYNVEVKMNTKTTVSGETNNDEKTSTIVVAKIDGKWYIIAQ